MVRAPSKQLGAGAGRSCHARNVRVWVVQPLCIIGYDVEPLRCSWGCELEGGCGSEEYCGDSLMSSSGVSSKPLLEGLRVLVALVFIPERTHLLLWIHQTG